MVHAFKSLAQSLEGTLHTDETTRILYATDASAYREIPAAVAYPRHTADIQQLVNFSRHFKMTLIPRAAGTSLAGQVVGNGIVVDVSRYMNKILEINTKERWVRVQPGVVRDELNKRLKSENLYFAPETSTANRATIGGMIGNNSCGSNSIVYGSTREHLLEVKAILADGNEVTFKALNKDEFYAKLSAPPHPAPTKPTPPPQQTTSRFAPFAEVDYRRPLDIPPAEEFIEPNLYRQALELFSNPQIRARIEQEFPKPSIPRRNTGYAIDLLMKANIFGTADQDFNFCKLIAGSEGTLCFITEAKLALVEPPPPYVALVCAHFETVYDSLQANLIALRHKPSASELLDHYVLECTANNLEQAKNRTFIQGNPGAILIIEISDYDDQTVLERTRNLVEDLKTNSKGYHFPIIMGAETKKVWDLRKAGLGVLSNMRGDAKPVPVVEDTAVDVHDLPAYIEEFDRKLAEYGLSCVHYAHAGSGELHLRPILNLKKASDQKLFRQVLADVAALVKKYRGSLSGEHGDGRLRGEFIPYMIGEDNYELLKAIKRTWDPYGVFNRGKITDTPSMNTFLRYAPDAKTPEVPTVFSWEKTDGFVRAAEQCNGSGDCLKSHLIGGTMCPSYMATRNERDSTRARANILREVFTQKSLPEAFASEEIKSVLDLCLSCKACKSECPSNVDMSKLKAEFLNGYHQQKGISWGEFAFGNFARIAHLACSLPGGQWSFNHLSRLSRFKQLLGIHPQRQIPPLAKQTFRQWYKRHKKPPITFRKAILFVDEFTEYTDVELGKTVIGLLEKLKYEVIIPPVMESGRTAISKGFLGRARFIAQYNTSVLYEALQSLSAKDRKDCLIVGIEPSAILTLRDEYVDLLPSNPKLATLVEKICTFEEFMVKEIESGYIKAINFKLSAKRIHTHRHCYQKALSAKENMDKIMALLRGCKYQNIPAGCCGMAGSFGYEKDHYEVSMQIGELVLFPYIRKTTPNEVIVASGTSCRHQIFDGTGRQAIHLAELLYELVI